MEDKVSTKKNCSDTHDDFSEAITSEEDVATGVVKSIQDEESDCASENSTNHETYYVFSDFKAQENNQVADIIVSW